MGTDPFSIRNVEPRKSRVRREQLVGVESVALLIDDHLDFADGVEQLAQEVNGIFILHG